VPQHAEWQEPWLRAGCLGDNAFGASAFDVSVIEE